MPLLQLPRSVGLAAPRWPFTLNAESQQARSLIGWWPFASGQPGDLRSSLGGSFGSAAGIAPMPLGLGATFDGTANARVEIADNDLLDFGTGAFAFDAWIHVASLAGERNIVAKRHATETNSPQWRCDVITTGAVNFVSFGGAESTVTTSAGVVETNRVHHVFWQRRSDGSMQIYVDGAQAVSATRTARNVTNGQPMWIGQDNRDVNRPFSGQMYHVRAWRDRDFSASEIWSLYAPQSRWELYYELGRRFYSFPAAAGGAGAQGSAAQTIASFTSSGLGLVGHPGSAAQTIAAFLSAGAGLVTHVASAANTMDAFTSEGEGVMGGKNGEAAQTIAAFVSAGAGLVGHVGSAAQVIDLFSSAGAGTVGHVGSAAQTMAAFSSAGVGQMGSVEDAVGDWLLRRRRRR